VGFEAPADTFRSGAERQPACDWERTNALEVARLWLLAEAALEDPAIGVKAGARASDYTASHSCPLLRLTLSQPTPRDAIATLIRYQLLISDTVNLEFEPADRDARVFRMRPPVLPDLEASRTVLRHQIGFGFAMMYRLIAVATGRRALLREVRLEQAAIAGTEAAYEEAFECAVRFGASENALVLEGALLDVRSSLADAEVADLLQTRAERTVASLGVAPWSSRVCRLLAEPRPSLPSLVEVAVSLAVSPRTLQRRLADEGTSFQALFQRVGLELAELQAGFQPADRVAERLGYSDQRAFERALRRWAGVTFAVYATRNRRRGPVAA
jgi:AraC-like DNA-binding protein